MKYNVELRIVDIPDNELFFRAVIEGESKKKWAIESESFSRELKFPPASIVESFENALGNRMVKMFHSK